MYSGVLLAFLLLPALCQAFFFGRDDPEWDGLKVKWGIPFNAFHDVPRTRNEAVEDGWTNMAPGVACDGNANFRGERYIKNNDLGVILIFDPAGYIAGIQAGIQKNYPRNPNNYPTDNFVGHPFVLENDVYYITAYFTNPADVCTGRTETQFENDGTGTGLWIQNGTDPVTQSISMPMTQREADNSRWTKGKCFYSMGYHYWYDITRDMLCDRLFPVFLMYNDGKLNSFGWAFGMNIETSDWLEHPLRGSYDSFMNPVPECLSNFGTLTTLHIYMTDSVFWANRC